MRKRSRQAVAEERPGGLLPSQSPFSSLPSFGFCSFGVPTKDNGPVAEGGMAMRGTASDEVADDDEYTQLRREFVSSRRQREAEEEEYRMENMNSNTTCVGSWPSTALSQQSMSSSTANQAFLEFQQQQQHFARLQALQQPRPSLSFMFDVTLLIAHSGRRLHLGVFDADASAGLPSVRTRIEEVTGVPPSQQRLIFSGRELPSSSSFSTPAPASITAASVSCTGTTGGIASCAPTPTAIFAPPAAPTHTRTSTTCHQLFGHHGTMRSEIFYQRRQQEECGGPIADNTSSECWPQQQQQHSFIDNTGQGHHHHHRLLQRCGVPEVGAGPAGPVSCSPSLLSALFPQSDPSTIYPQDGGNSKAVTLLLFTAYRFC